MVDLSSYSTSAEVHSSCMLSSESSSVIPRTRTPLTYNSREVALYIPRTCSTLSSRMFSKRNTASIAKKMDAGHRSHRLYEPRVSATSEKRYRRSRIFASHYRLSCSPSEISQAQPKADRLPWRPRRAHDVPRDNEAIWYNRNQRTNGCE